MFLPVGSWSVDVVVTVSDCTDNDTANSPEHLKHLSGWSTQLDWDDLRAVCRSICNEDTPRKTLQELSSEDNGQGISVVEHEDEHVQGHQADESGPSVSHNSRKRSSKEHTDEGTELSRDLKS